MIIWSIILRLSACVRVKGGSDGHKRSRNSHRPNDPSSGRSVRYAQQISVNV